MSGVDEAGVVGPEGGSMRKLLRVTAEGGPVDLAAIDPRSMPGLPGGAGSGRQRKEWAREQVELLGADLGRHQEMLYAAAKGAAGPEAPTSAPTAAGAHLDGDRPRRVLLVLQAMDCGGKDGTVRKVAGRFNPAGVSIASFGPPRV